MLLERDRELGVMADLLADLGSGGKVVLIRGEAGIGKSSLVREFADSHRDETEVMFGFCDDLLTPQPLGPFWDVAREHPSLLDPLQSGDRLGVLTACLQLLSREEHSTTLVIEDTHWADAATLDLIKYLGRRIARTNSILMLTYRDGEVDFDHPLRTVIGELPPQNLVRIHLERLSTQAVASLVDDTDLVLDEVVALTGGNPLFVTEIVASGLGPVPSSVQDSVLARASKLSPRAHQVLDLVSVMPGQAERSVVESILSPTSDQLTECVRQGLLLDGLDGLTFRHELSRQAIEASLSVTHRRELNRQVLAALGSNEDPARLVHHARAADDVAAIIEFGPLAARAATAIESYREAAAHFRTLDAYLERIAAADQAAILADWALVEYYLDDVSSLDLFDRAIELHRSGGDDHALARTLRDAARVNRTHLRTERALELAREAVDLLEGYPESGDLADCLAMFAFIEWTHREDAPNCVEIADRALAIAERVGDDQAFVNALNTKGHILFSAGDPGGMSLMEESRRRAEISRNRIGELRALVHMTGMAADIRDVERAADLAQRARDTAARYEMSMAESDAQAMYAEILMWKGDWSAAEDAANEALASSPAVETVALRVLGTLQARRGRSDSGIALGRMWSLAREADQLTLLDPAAAVLAEHMWLSGDPDPDWLSSIQEILETGISIGTPWPSGALAFWMWMLGYLDSTPEGTADFYGWIIDGESGTAAEFWEARGLPYEHALALMHGDQSEQIEAIRIFDGLGAKATADRVRDRLLGQGVRVPRGRSRATRDHAAGLTARQAEVLVLLAEQLTNAEIADRLFVSHRTVENHVAAILMKLDVSARDAAVVAAREQGLLPI